MPPLPPMLNYLALVIDLREERLEKTTIPFLRKQIVTELEILRQRLRTEYENFMTTTGQDPAVELKRIAA